MSNDERVLGPGARGAIGEPAAEPEGQEVDVVVPVEPAPIPEPPTADDEGA